MIADKIRNARKALSALGGQVSEDVWATIKCIQHELDDAGDQVAEIESTWEVPQTPQNQKPAAAAAQA
jgi:hypothetical protein